MDHMLHEGLQPLANAVSACVRAHMRDQPVAQRLATRLTVDEALDLLAPMRSVLEAGLDGSGLDGEEEEVKANGHAPSSAPEEPATSSVG